MSNGLAPSAFVVVSHCLKNMFCSWSSMQYLRAPFARFRILLVFVV